MPDPVSIVVGGALAYIGVRGTNFLDKVLEPVAKEVGQGLLQRYRTFRDRRAAKAVDEAAEMLEAAGETPQPVPGRILFPLLDYASLEDDDSMSRRWSALLANAASESSANEILPGYLDVLRQLTPLQAKILDWMHGQEHERAWPDVPNFRDIPRAELESTFNLSPRHYAIIVTDLDRLKCVRGHNPSFEAAWNSKVQYDVIMLTAFGLGFVAACRPPRPSQPAGPAASATQPDPAGTARRRARKAR